MHFRFGANVNASRRLIKDNNPRISSQQLGKNHLLLVAARKLACILLAATLNAELLDVAVGELAQPL